MTRVFSRKTTPVILFLSIAHNDRTPKKLPNFKVKKEKEKNRWKSQNVCNDSLSNNHSVISVMKVSPEISCMSAVRAHYGGVISCNISGRP